MKLIFKAVLIGCSVAFLPQMLASVPIESEAVEVLLGISTYLLIPGVAACIVLGATEGHDVNFVLTLVLNGMFYSGLAFLVLWLRSRRKSWKATTFE